MNEIVRSVIAQRQAALKGKLPSRVWLCGSCGHVMGVFSEDYNYLEIKTAKVKMTVSGGSINRECHRCHHGNEITTRQKGQSIEDWLSDHCDRIAPFANP